MTRVYVVFKPDQYHTIGNIKLTPRSVAFFDVKDERDIRMIVANLFSGKILNSGIWTENVIKKHASDRNKTFVDINSLI